MLLNYINWNVEPDIVSFWGITIRYYGVLFAASFFFGYLIMQKIFKQEGLTVELLDKLTVYMAIGTIAGARLCQNSNDGRRTRHIGRRDRNPRRLRTTASKEIQCPLRVPLQPHVRPRRAVRVYEVQHQQPGRSLRAKQLWRSFPTIRSSSH